MTTCPVCGNTIPEGEFCGACGAHLTTGSAHRMGAFAVDPSQHVLQPNVVSTLFPHLPHRQSTPFRLGLLFTAILLAVLGTARLTGPAIAVAAVSVPLLYLLYLYEVEVYEREPALVIGLTMGLGLLLGIPWAVITGPIITHALLHNITAGVSFSSVLLEGVLFPVVAQALMLVGAVILYFRGHHREPLDGFTFGAAGALGFIVSTTLINLGPELRQGLFGGAPAITNALMVLTRGLLIPFLTASTAGLIAGALWMRRQPRRRSAHGWTTSLPAAIAAAIAVDIVLGVVGITVLRLGVVVAIYLVVASALLIWVRLALHAMLLTEAGSAEIGPPLPCPNCHWLVPRMTFCPHCGIATGATPKRGVGRLREEGPAAGDASGSHRAATPEELATLGRRGSPRRAWGGVAAIVAAGAVALGVTAVIVTPSRGAACHAICAPPPPPCLGFCKHASKAPPLRTDKSYTSSTYGYSVDYTGFAPSNQDDSSVEWDLSSDTGQYTVEEAATHPNGRSAQDVLGDVINNNFQDYSHLYDVPGSEVGYVSGAGAVYDDESTPFFGTATNTRLVVLTAESKDVAVVIVGNGDASSDQGSQPDPSGLPVSSFVDNLADATRWPGQAPR